MCGHRGLDLRIDAVIKNYSTLPELQSTQNSSLCYTILPYGFYKHSNLSFHLLLHLSQYRWIGTQNGQRILGIVGSVGEDVLRE